MKELLDHFTEICGKPDLIAQAPGRINIIGEHVDYNGGIVLPAAISMYCTVAMKRRDDDQIIVRAFDVDEECEQSVMNIKVGEGWQSYVFGAIKVLQETRSFDVGFDLWFSSDIPVGAGLSSSAALTSSVLFTLNKFFNLDQDLISLAGMAQQVEHRFAGVRCGIMDMFVSLHGKENHALALDTSALTFHYVPARLEDAVWLLVDSGVSHSLADSQYNVRRHQCEKALEFMRNRNRALNSLSDWPMSRLKELEEVLDATLFKRVSHVLWENQRVDLCITALKSGDLKTFGNLLNASHRSLSEDYEVSCEELDFLAHRLQKLYGVYGARMMGGGFGGCVLALCSDEYCEDIERAISDAYAYAFGNHPNIYSADIAEGTHFITL